jgi:4-alpha-glucanotransferase
VNNILNKRRAGVLLHITSLPGSYKQGDLGQDAYNFINFLKSTGVTVWQTLPLGMPHADGSPYQCLSAHAGNPALIDIENLVKLGWLHPSEHCEACQGNLAFNKTCLVEKALKGFLELANQSDRKDYLQFCQEKAFWLDDFALFMALRNVFNQQSWRLWPEPFKERNSTTLSEARKRLATSIEQYKFEQYIFFRQWMALKDYANSHDVLLFGDIPIFVSYDSADVWANRKVFKLNKSGEPLITIGNT